MDPAIPRTPYEFEHEAFRRTVRQFFSNEVLPEYAKWEEAGITPRLHRIYAGTNEVMKHIIGKAL